MKNAYPIRYMASLVWIGCLLAISFMEAPLKFQAPSVTLSIGLEIGRLVFGMLNKMEWILLLLMILSLILSDTDKRTTLLVVALTFILMGQTFYLLPLLDQRAEAIISGLSTEPNNLHFLYVGMEIIKLIVLATSTLYFIYNTKSHENAIKYST